MFEIFFFKRLSKVSNSKILSSCIFKETKTFSQLSEKNLLNRVHCLKALLINGKKHLF